MEAPRRRQGWLAAAGLGAGAGGATVAVMLLLRLTLGVPSLMDVTGTGAVLLLPGSIFGALIDGFQEKGRPLLLLGASLLVILVGAALAALRSTSSGGARAPRVSVRPQGRSPIRALGWALPAVGLWVISLPLVAVAEGGLASSATATVLLDWLLLAGLVELLVRPRRRVRAGVGAPGPEGPNFLSRRQFLGAGGGALGLASLGYLSAEVLGARAPSAGGPSAAGAIVGTLPSVVTKRGNFYVVYKDLLGPPSVEPSAWSLSVGGLDPFQLSYQELLRMPAVEQIQTLECISNPVGGTLISNGVWRGVRLADLLERARIPTGTEAVDFSCVDAYTESLPLAEATAPTTLVATHLDGAVLAPEHGFPARLLVVGHYGMKNPKWLTEIRPARTAGEGFWEMQGWSPGSPPHIFSRFDFPSGGTQLRVGRRYLVTGVAYAGSRGIGAVEVSFDGGRQWEPATLRPALSAYAWTIWSRTWAPAAGIYSLTVRARDTAGNLQTPSSEGSFPNGATGYQVLNVVVN